MSVNQHILEGAKELHIVVIGDIMLDRYIHGDVVRMSPEAPVPVVTQSSLQSILGGAANVAANLVAMDARTTLLGFVGDDIAGSKTRSLLDTTAIDTRHVYSTHRKTTVKTRVLDKGQQLLRIDEEETSFFDLADQTKLLLGLRSVVAKDMVSGIIIQDYNKGLLPPQVIQEIMVVATQNKIPVYVDPKFMNFWEYRGCTVFKPNKKELEAMYSDKDVARGLEYLMLDALKRLECDILLCTLADQGIAACSRAGFVHCPTTRIDEVDVSGAGDSTMSIFVIAHLLRHSIHDMMRYGNTVGRLACLSDGVSVITIDQIRNDLSA